MKQFTGMNQTFISTYETENHLELTDSSEWTWLSKSAKWENCWGWTDSLQCIGLSNCTYERNSVLGWTNSAALIGFSNSTKRENNIGWIRIFSFTWEKESFMMNQFNRMNQTFQLHIWEKQSLGMNQFTKTNQTSILTEREWLRLNWFKRMNQTFNSTWKKEPFKMNQLSKMNQIFQL